MVDLKINVNKCVCVCSFFYIKDKIKDTIEEYFFTIKLKVRESTAMKTLNCKCDF